MSRILIYYKYDRAGSDRWVRGDRHIRRRVRSLVRGPDPVGGIDLVYLNLCAGLDRLGIPYATNVPFSDIRSDDLVGVIGRGLDCLDGYTAENPILAGVAVVGSHPGNWPTLFEDTKVRRYVVHSAWVRDMFAKIYPDVVTWSVGIDTEEWVQAPDNEKSVDILVYDKVRWDHDKVHRGMVSEILAGLARRGLSTTTIRYGAYKPEEFKAALAKSRAMLFLCEHETQGLAYQQAMAAGLPILAWEPGQWLDPWRYRFGETYVPATTVPFFDEGCGMTFAGLPQFEATIDDFMDDVRTGAFDPRRYVLNTLTLEKCSAAYVDLLKALNA